MTKVSVFGEEPKKEGKPIELVDSLIGTDWEKAKRLPKTYSGLMLLEKDYFSRGRDLIWCYDKVDDGILHMGHWNDGFVE